MIRKLTSIFVITAFLSLFSGCYDAGEVDDKTYVVAIGLDKGTVMPLRMTFQYALASAITPGGGGGSESSTKKVNSVSIECVSVLNALSVANNFIAKQLNISHTVALIISEEVAKGGVGRYLRGFIRNREFRPTVYVAISKCSAEDFIKSVNPIQESDPSKFYQLLFENYRLSGTAIGIQFYKFYSRMESLAVEAAANLVDISRYTSTKEFTSEPSTSKEKGMPHPRLTDFMAGDIVRVGDQKGEMMGVAVFHGDKFVGELDGACAISYLMTIGELERAPILVPDPKVRGRYIAVYVKERSNPKRKVDISGENPKISLEIHLEGDITSIQSGYYYEASKYLPILEKATSDAIKKDIEFTLNKAAVDYKSDIFGFGKEVRKKFLTYDEWKKYDWFGKFPGSTFDVKVDFKVRRPGLIIRSMPLGEEEREEQ